MSNARLTQAVALLAQAAALLREEEAARYEAVKAFPERRFRDPIPEEEQRTRDVWWSCGFYVSHYIDPVISDLSRLLPGAPPVRVRPRPQSPTEAVHPGATPPPPPTPVRTRVRPQAAK